MGAAVRKDIQRQANKAYQDPRSWDKVNRGNQQELMWARGGNQNNPGNAERVVLQDLMQSARIDADEYWKAMDDIEKEHRSKTKIDPDEVTNALRMELYQQRQYLSYKDTMQRMGVPSNQILPIEKWEEEHDRPMPVVDQDTYHQISDRVHNFEMVTDPVRDPMMHDYFSPIEDGDNRLSQRMLAELLELKEESKLDFNTAGRELERDPEILRRICASIAIPPPTIIPDTNVDAETLYHLSQNGQFENQTYAKAYNVVQNMFRKQTPEYLPQNIPASGFQPPSSSQRS